MSKPTKTKPANKPQFNIGDRVKYDPPRPALFSCQHGQVVYYHGQHHNPANPRVRWQSGWGTTCKAGELALLTPAEAASLPAVQLVDCDLLTP